MLSWIGAGGMGNVYRVRHNMMDSDYALKTLSADKVTEVAWRRFQNEAQAIARMSHPNIVGIYNLGLHENRLPFYVMDLLEGDTLNDLLRDHGPMPMRDAMKLFIELCGGFGYAHKKGIVHRDIKPPNIVLLKKPESTCRAKIVDFGIAKLSGIKDPENQFLTNAGEVCGSPYYMSPEQTIGQRIDARSDIYSLGCTLFEALTGAPPLRGRSAVDTMMMHQTTVPPTLKVASGGKDFPDSLENLIATLLAKEPMDRYQTMELVAQDMTTILAGGETAVNAAINPFAAQVQKIQKSQKDQQGMTSNTNGGRVGGRLYQAEEDKESASGAGGKIIALLSALLIVGGAAGGFFWWKSQTAAKQATVVKTQNPTPVPDDVTIVSQGELDEAEDVMTDKSKNMPPPTVSLNDTKPYSHIEIRNGVQWRVFEFPTDFVVGKIKSNYEGYATNCRGIRTYRAIESLSFMPVPALLKYPQYVKRFRPNELRTLHMSGEGVTDDLLKLTHTLVGISKLQFSQCPKMTTDCFKYIPEMKALNALQFDDHSFTPEQLRHQPCITKVKELGFSYHNDVEPYLELIKGSPAIQSLIAAKTNISTKGMEYITSLPNLVKLQLDGSHVQASDIVLLAKMPKLKALFFIDQKIDARMLAALKKLKNVQYMLVSANCASPASDASILAALKPIRVERVENARIEWIP